MKEHDHSDGAIRSRIEEGPSPSFLEDGVLGAVDGAVTTFATVAGAIGGGFPEVVVVVLGLAKLLADGFSMAASNFLSTHGRQSRIESARLREREHIANVPDGEREEVRQIFARKGFEGELLEKVVDTITADEQVWVETMMCEELGLTSRPPSPVRSALATFLAFLVVGAVPLAAFLVPGLGVHERLAISGSLTALEFVGIGIVKGKVLGRPVLASALTTLAMGGIAAALAFVVSHLLRSAYGV
jgi:VIT1/CCC1 family predicted Fe2+/Mn2+ transporter